MHNKNKLPHFTWHLPNPPNEYFAWIEADGAVIHRITDLPDFFMTLGLTRYMKEVGALQEEFNWADYIKFKAVNLTACLQLHIMKYLNAHDEAFRGKYKKSYEMLLQACTCEKKLENAVCSRCGMSAHACENESTNVIQADVIQIAKM